MFGLIADLLSSFLTILFPIFASYKALRSSETSQLAPLLVYWVVLSVVLLAESWTVFILGWFPFYSWFRLLFLCYLVLPQTQGARVLYQQYIDPFLFRHERDIEQFLDRGHERAKELGLQYFYLAIELIREKVLGLPPQQQQGGGGAAPPSGVAGYAQSIFSQFNAPSGGSSGNAPAPANDWFSSVSSAIAGSQGQREVDMDGSGSPLRKNRSDNSFHHVSHEDTRERSPAGGSGWASGWFGQQGEQGGSSAVDFAARAAEEMSRARGS